MEQLAFTGGKVVLENSQSVFGGLGIGNFCAGMIGGWQSPKGNKSRTTFGGDFLTEARLVELGQKVKRKQ